MDYVKSGCIRPLKAAVDEVQQTHTFGWLELQYAVNKYFIHCFFLRLMLPHSESQVNRLLFTVGTPHAGRELQ